MQQPDLFTVQPPPLPPLAQEHADRAAQRDRVAAYFRAHPDTWIGRETLIAHGSGSAPQTRVSECKLQLGMRIESRPTRYTGPDGRTHRGFQEYRYRGERA